MNRLPTAGVLTALLIFAADQGAKYAVTGPLAIDSLGDVREIVEIFALRFVPNIGVSLGLLPAGGDATRWALVALTAAIAAGVLVWMTRERNRQDQIALGLVLGARWATSSIGCGLVMSSISPICILASGGHFWSSTSRMRRLRSACSSCLCGRCLCATSPQRRAMGQMMQQGELQWRI